MRVAPWSPTPERTTWGEYRADLTLTRVLTAALDDRAARVMLTGAPPPRDFFLEPLPPGWEVARLFLDLDTPAAKYRHPHSDHAVEIRRAAEWFGDGTYTRTDAREAWDATARILAGSGRSGAAMFRSPGATGFDLWLRTTGGDVPDPLDDELQQLIRSTTPQHRIELVPPTGRDELPGLWVYDGRLMYAALLRELGAGPAQRLLADDAERLAADPYSRARYRVRFAAPEWWGDTGLPNVILTPAGPSPRDGWHTPREGEAWVDAAELHLARRYDWTATVLEAIAYTKGRPLDAWGARLLRARDRATDDALGATVGPLVRSAIRACLLHAVGSFHSTGRAEMTITASPMQRPFGDGWDAPTTADDGRAIWRRQWSPSAPTARMMAGRHPEWSAGVYGRSHARILESPTSHPVRKAGALRVPRGQLVSIYGDAVMTSARQPWADLDDGQVGRLRLKGHLCGPIPYPTTARERDQASRAATAAGTTCEKGCP